MSEALSWNHWRANDIFCIHLIKQTFLSLCLDDDEYKSICCRTTFKSSFSSPITWTYHEQWSVRFLLLSLKNKQLCREKRLTCLEGKSFFLDICKTKFFFVYHWQGSLSSLTEVDNSYLPSRKKRPTRHCAWLLSSPSSSLSSMMSIMRFLQNQTIANETSKEGSSRPLLKYIYIYLSIRMRMSLS